MNFLRQSIETCDIYILKETVKVDISHQKITSNINNYRYLDIVKEKKSTTKISHRFNGSRSLAFTPRHHVTKQIFHARLQKTIILEYLQVLKPPPNRQYTKWSKFPSQVFGTLDQGLSKNFQHADNPQSNFKSWNV